MNKSIIGNILDNTLNLNTLRVITYNIKYIMSKDVHKEYNVKAHIRLEYFNKRLFQFGKEPQLPKKLLNNIIIKYEGKNANAQDIRNYLKKYKYPRYYEHIKYILYKVNGTHIEPLSLSNHDKSIFDYLFIQIYNEYTKCAPKNKLGFFPYKYLTMHIFNLMNKNNYIKHLHYNITKEKCTYLDKIWKKICDKLDFKYINTLNLLKHNLT
jgi:hypothetical protein